MKKMKSILLVLVWFLATPCKSEDQLLIAFFQGSLKSLKDELSEIDKVDQTPLRVPVYAPITNFKSELASHGEIKVQSHRLDQNCWKTLSNDRASARASNDWEKYGLVFRVDKTASNKGNLQASGSLIGIAVYPISVFTEENPVFKNLDKLKRFQQGPEGEQGGAEKPATAPESKAKGSKELKPESDRRSQ